MKNQDSQLCYHVWLTTQSWHLWYIKNKIPKQKFPKGIIVHVHKKGWMDDGGIQIWQKIVPDFFDLGVSANFFLCTDPLVKSSRLFFDQGSVQRQKSGPPDQGVRAKKKVFLCGICFSHILLTVLLQGLGGKTLL